MTTMIERMQTVMSTSRRSPVSRDEVIAILEAMREPSAGMCKTLGVFPDPPVKNDDPDKAMKLAPMLGIYHIWNGLIDAALSEDGLPTKQGAGSAETRPYPPPPVHR